LADNAFEKKKKMKRKREKWMRRYPEFSPLPFLTIKFELKRVILSLAFDIQAGPLSQGIVKQARSNYCYKGN